MALYIKDPKADRLARQLAKRNGETITSAVIRALEAQTARLSRQREQRALKRDIDAILERIHALPILDPRTPDEILGYDENGLPT